MLKKKLKVIVGTLLAVVLISQLAIPYSLTPAFAQAKDSILKPVNSPPTNNSNDKKPDSKNESKGEPTKDKLDKDNSNSKPKTEVTQPKPKTELSDKKLNSDNSPLKIEPLKELKSQDRSSSSEKRYKHVKMNKLPQIVKMYLNKESEYFDHYYIKLDNLKPNSFVTLRFKGNPGSFYITADDYGTARGGFDLERRNEKYSASDITFFEGDIEGTTLVEEEMVTFDLVVMSDEKVEGIFIEVYDENNNIIDSGKTNRKGNRLFNLKLPLESKN